jgi:hypothetical protein
VVLEFHEARRSEISRAMTQNPTLPITVRIELRDFNRQLDANNLTI